MGQRVRVLRVRGFRYLLLGQAASLIGDQAAIVALALFVTRRTGSASDLGLVLGAQAAALALLVLLGGVWADRLPRRRIMISADLARAALHLTLAVLILTAGVRLWQVIAIEAAFGCAEAFFAPAFSGLLPQTVPEEMIAPRWRPRPGGRQRVASDRPRGRHRAGHDSRCRRGVHARRGDVPAERGAAEAGDAPPARRQRVCRARAARPSGRMAHRA